MLKIWASGRLTEGKLMRKPKRIGLVIVNTGGGKGKTTAALGVALRASGSNMKVLMIQFIKGSWDYGELHAAEKLAPNFEIIPMGEGFTWETKNKKKDTEVALKAWNFCKEKIQAGEHDILIFDEIINAIDYGYLDVHEVITAIRKRPEGMHVILTGRNAPPELIDAADLVTEMKEIKHPFSKGVIAQKGIEF